MTFNQVRKSLLRSNVQISKFVLKKTFKTLKKWKVVKTTKKDNKHYKLTGKRCPANLMNKQAMSKRAIKAQKKADRKFRAKLRRQAHKVARGGRTMEQCANDVLKSHKKMTMNKMLTYLNKHNVVVSKFVLKLVLQRMREKGVFKIYQGITARLERRCQLESDVELKNTKILTKTVRSVK